MSLLPSVSKPVAATIGVSDDPLPDLEVERGPENKGVGRWVPEQKHFLLAKYIVGTRAAARKWPQRVLIDPFCGPGRIQVKGESFTRDGGAVVAWRQSQSTGVSTYTKLLVGDISRDRAVACAARLKALGANVQSFVGEARATILEMKGAVPRGALCFAYLDPYNLELLTSIFCKLWRCFRAWISLFTSAQWTYGGMLNSNLTPRELVLMKQRLAGEITLK